MRLESIAAVVLRWGVIGLPRKGAKCTFGVGLAKNLVLIVSNDC